VKFHNGEPWNAEAAKFGIDINGDVKVNRSSFRYHGEITGVVVDEFTLDVNCKDPCPIFPNSAIFTTFQAPKWYQATSKEVRTRTNVGAGPYKVMEWRPGLDIRLEAFQDYLPNKHVDSQAPSIKNVTQVWRGEGLVRTAMVKTGEADWAMDIGLDGRKQVPAFKQSGTTEVFALVVDTIWHPELKKKQVRQALAHAIDCKALVQALYEGLPECIGNISVRGTLGITPRNYAPHEYNPTLAKQLLQQAGYDPKNKINIYVEANRVYRDVEFLEAVARFWTDVGVTNEMVILEASKAAEMRNSGCGKFGKEALDCPNRQPPPPHSGSSHVFTTATSNEMLDMQVLAFRRMGCFSILSRVCSPELQSKIETAMATPLGSQRKQRMEELGDIAHDEVYFISFFHNLLVYGFSSDLAWEPLYAPRLRVNTMKFK
jgi:ABC-type transport system substrate-binding protein